MSLLVRAFPLKASEADLQKFIAELQGPRRADVDSFYQEHGVTHESWYVQETEHGPWVIGLTQVEDVQESAPRFAQHQGDFPAWFRAQIQKLTGVDTSATPLGPPTTLVYEYSDCETTRSCFAPPQLG